MTGTTLAKATTVLLWNNNTAYITKTGTALVKVTTASLWKDTACNYNNDWDSLSKGDDCFTVK